MVHFSVHFQKIILVIAAYCCCLLHVEAFQNIFRRNQLATIRNSLESTVLQSSTQTSSSTDRDKLTQQLVGSNIVCSFNGFGMEEGKNFTCVIKIDSKTESDFGGDVQAANKGFWRVVPAGDSGEDLPMIEVAQAVMLDYVYYFDLDERQLFWRGSYDPATKKVTAGKVVARKKRFFGLVPYEETIATFEGSVYLAGEEKPKIEDFRIEPKYLAPPEDFYGPEDMEKYPELFAPEFVDWFNSVEDALAKGEEPPPRPEKNFFPMTEQELARRRLNPGSDNESMDSKNRKRRSSGFKK